MHVPEAYYLHLHIKTVSAVILRAEYTFLFYLILSDSQTQTPLYYEI